MYNILLGGAAGDGIATMSTLLEKLLKQAGFYVFTTRDFMSRVRGGHNFVQIRFGETPIHSDRKQLDGIFAMNAQTFILHQNELADDGFVICDTELTLADKRMLALPLMETAEMLGNAKVSTSVAIGTILSLFQIDLSKCEQVLGRIFKAPLVKINLAAIQKGYAMAAPRYKMNPQNLAKHMLVSGTNALTLGAIAAGLK